MLLTKKIRKKNIKAVIITAFFYFTKLNSTFEIPRNYRVERKATRGVRIKIQNDLTVSITVPFLFSGKHILEIISKKQKWIDRNLETFARRRKVFALRENELLLFGTAYTFIIQPDLKRKIRVSGEEKSVQSGVDLISDSPARYNFYKKYAAEYLTAKTETAAERHGFSYNRLFIRGQKTKWGTCSAKKNLSLNWRLILCPESVIDYLIVHELVHTEIINHSKSYWARVAELCPGFREAKKWLDENSYAVHRV